MRTWLALPALLALGVSACAEPPAARSAQPLAAPTAAATTEVERFLPLQANTVFSYGIWRPETDQPDLLILQVERPSAQHANLRTGSSVKRLEFVADGVRLVTGGYLLKAPLQNGADWVGPAGRVRISSVDQTVKVAAGAFAGCLETTETDQRAARSILTTYCPGVGIVKFSVDDGDRQERFELKSFGPRVDVNDVQ